MSPETKFLQVFGETLKLTVQEKTHKNKINHLFIISKIKLNIGWKGGTKFIPVVKIFSSSENAILKNSVLWRPDPDLLHTLLRYDLQVLVDLDHSAFQLQI